jgi:hypothetical protein
MDPPSPTDSFLAIPIAAVADNWLVNVFLPQAEDLLAEFTTNGGVVVWLPVDASSEGDYLLTKLYGLCGRRGWKVHEIEVSEHDPYLFWADVLGTPEKAGICRSIPSSVLLVRSGELLLPSTIRLHLASLVDSSKAEKCCVVVPVFRNQSDLLLLAPASPQFQVPALADVSPERRLGLAEALVRSRFPALKVAERRELAETLLSAGPLSRPQLEYWLDTLQDAEDPVVQVRRASFRHDEPAHQPPAVPSRSQLHRQFNQALAHLKETNLLFRRLCNTPLFFLHQPLRDPFSTSEPADWFMSIVSFLSCLIFDAGETTLDCIAGFRFDANQRDIVGEPVSTLLIDLRLLRTSLQHAMSLDNKDNQKKLRDVESWYRRRCGEPSPRPDHYRLLVTALVDEWETFVRGISEVVSNMMEAPSSLAVQNALAAARRHLPLGDLLQLIRESVATIDPAVDGDRVKRKHEQSIQRALKECCYTGNAFYDYARHLVEMAVANESNNSPIDGVWLQQQGIQQGRDTARWKQHFQERWDSASSSVSIDEFKRQALAEIVRSRVAGASTQLQ